MKNRGKIFFCILVVLGIFCLVSVNNAEAAQDKCYQLFFNSSCIPDGNYDYRSWDFDYVELFTDGTFYDVNCDCGGTWVRWKSSLTIMYDDLPEGTFLSGSKKQGFYVNTDGSWNASDYWPGCWYLKKVNCKAIVSSSVLDNPDPERRNVKKPGGCLR